MMHDEERESAERLWEEYRSFLNGFDDPTLARWIAQIIGQLNGGIWRASHPLCGVFRLGAFTAHQRGLRPARHARIPEDFREAACCGAPMIPLFTRDIVERGFVCPFCDGTVMSLDELPEPSRAIVQGWAENYDRVHSVAHWDDRKKLSVRSFEEELEKAAEQASLLWVELVDQILPTLIPEIFPAIIWEDQDECLDIRPEDLA
jgi:hypothetical protein